MRLSEHERRVLAELDADLTSSDPRFARRFGPGAAPALHPAALPSAAPPRPRLRVLGLLRLLRHRWD